MPSMPSDQTVLQMDSSKKIMDEVKESKITVVARSEDLELKENVRGGNLETKPDFPLFVYSEDFFFSSKRYDPLTFNSWYRKNGWKAPINIMMPTTIMGYFVGCASFFAYLNRLITNPFAFWISNGVIGILAITLGYSMYVAISTDVMDKEVAKACQVRNVEYVKFTGVPVIDPDSRLCNICQVRVRQGTKHCKACNKFH